VENFSSPLTGLPEDSKLGSSDLISDSELTSARDELAFALGQNWALVGWDLQQAKTRRDIGKTLKRVRGINCEALEVFRRRLTLETENSAPEIAMVHELRKQLDESREYARKAVLGLGEVRQQFENIDRALKKLDRFEKGSLPALRDEKKANLVQVQSRFRNRQARHDSLEIRLEQMEGLFAQSELLDFINSRRHRLNPLNFANAMAGVPYMAWRQSRKRCLLLPTKPPKSLRYAQFEVLSKACPPPVTARGDACSQLRDYLLGPGCAEEQACQELAKYWRYLRLATEFTYPALSVAREQLPFLLLRDIQIQIEGQSESEAILAENERLQIGQKPID
jgi:hypothetical protein